MKNQLTSNSITIVEENPRPLILRLRVIDNNTLDTETQITAQSSDNLQNLIGTATHYTSNDNASVSNTMQIAQTPILSEDNLTSAQNLLLNSIENFRSQTAGETENPVSVLQGFISNSENVYNNRLIEGIPTQQQTEINSLTNNFYQIIERGFRHAGNFITNENQASNEILSDIQSRILANNNIIQENPNLISHDAFINTAQLMRPLSQNQQDFISANIATQALMRNHQNALNENRILENSEMALFDVFQLFGVDSIQEISNFLQHHHSVGFRIFFLVMSGFYYILSSGFFFRVRNVNGSIQYIRSLETRISNHIREFITATRIMRDNLLFNQNLEEAQRNTEVVINNSNNQIVEIQTTASTNVEETRSNTLNNSNMSILGGLRSMLVNQWNNFLNLTLEVIGISALAATGVVGGYYFFNYTNRPLANIEQTISSITSGTISETTIRPQNNPTTINPDIELREALENGANALKRIARALINLIINRNNRP